MAGACTVEEAELCVPVPPTDLPGIRRSKYRDVAMRYAQKNHVVLSGRRPSSIEAAVGQAWACLSYEEAAAFGV